MDLEGPEVGVLGESKSVREDVGKSVTGRTESSGSVPFVQAEILQLPKEATGSVQTSSSDSEKIFESLNRSNERNSFSVNVENDVEKLMGVKSERTNLSLRLKK